MKIPHRPTARQAHGKPGRRAVAATPGPPVRPQASRPKALPRADGPEAAGVPNFETFDRMLRAIQARFTQGVSPTAISSAWMDWIAHLAGAPGKQTALAARAGQLALRHGMWLAHAATGAAVEPMIVPPAHDTRFADKAWSVWPFDAVVQSYLLAESWWQEAVLKVPGMTRQHQDEVDVHDAPAERHVLRRANIPWLNPVVMTRSGAGERVQLSCGGTQNWLEDVDRLLDRQAAMGNRGVHPRAATLR